MTSEAVIEDGIEAHKEGDEDMEKIYAKYPSLKKQVEAEDDTESHDGREERLAQFIKNHADAEDMKSNPGRLREAMDEFAAQHDFLISIGPDKARIIANLVLENKPRVLVELGGYVGYSAMVFAEQMRNHASDARPVHVWSLEMDEKIATIAKDFISLAGLQDLITVETGPADETLRRLKKEGKLEKIDFLFLDHVEDLYEQDLKVVMDELELLSPNACIVADNVLRPGAPKYREYVRNHARLRSRGLKGLIIPGEFEVRLLKLYGAAAKIADTMLQDEIEVSKLLPAESGEEDEEEGKKEE